MSETTEILAAPKGAMPADDVPTDASAAVTAQDWRALIARIGAEEGGFDALGTQHVALFVDDGKTLLVSFETCLLYTSPSPRDRTRSRMPSSA